MRCSRRTDSAFRRAVPALFAALLGAALSAFTMPALAGGISVEYATTKAVESGYQLDARIKFGLDEEILAALEHGVELHIDVSIRVERERKWLWDPLVAEKSMSYTLQHHPLSQDYVVTDLAHEAQHQFPSVSAALKSIGEISNLPLVGTDELTGDWAYVGYIRAGLNIQMLPAPLQPAAYVSEKWRLQSAWYEWVVR